MTAEPPTPGYDDLSEAQLHAWLRTLPADELERLLDYEQAHADRAEVLLAGEQRLAALSAAARLDGAATARLFTGEPGLSLA